MPSFGTMLKRGLLLRCPVCGKGAIYRRPFVLNEECPACTFRFERESGYFTAAIAINLVLCEFVATAVIIPLAFVPGMTLLMAILIMIPIIVITPLLTLHHCRAIWMAVDHFMNPISREARDGYMEHFRQWELSRQQTKKSAL